MLRAMKPLTGYKLCTSESIAGRCTDFLFDDQTWTVRYVVAKTGTWISNRRILLSPNSLQTSQDGQQVLTTSLSSKQIEEAPPLADDAPVSRQYQMIWATHYGATPYWSELGPLSKPRATHALANMKAQADHDEHLRSFAELCGYEIAAVAPDRHGDVLGRVEDFLLDVSRWKIRYVVVETEFSWMSSRKVLVAPSLFDTVGWAEKNLYIELDGRKMKEFPEYDPTTTAAQNLETAIVGLLARSTTWIF